MGIEIFGKFDNRQVDGYLLDYKDIDKAPILEQDLNGFAIPKANTYYKHTGSNGSFIKGVVYYYDGTEYKPLDGSGDLKNVEELDTQQVTPGEIAVDDTVTPNSKNVVTSGAVAKAIGDVTNVIAGVQTEVNKIPRITVDKALNSSSTNPVENKAVNAAVQQLTSEITRVESKVVTAGDYVDKESSQTITGVKVFKNIQVDEVLFQTQDGKYGCTLYSPQVTSPSTKDVYLPKKSGTLALESDDLMGQGGYQRITTSEGYLFTSKISIPLPYGFANEQHSYEIEWTFNNAEGSRHLSTIGNLMQKQGGLAHEEEYVCLTEYHITTRIEFYAAISIDEEDSSDNGTFELGVNIQGSPEGLSYVYIHSIRAKAR